MNSNEQGNHRLSVPAGLVEQLQSMTSTSGNTKQSGPESMPPGPSPRPVNEISDNNADD